MIEARTNGEEQAPKANTPETITTSMIIEDLENGIDRAGIKEKYGLENWEVTQMFKHPALKGKKVRKVKKMSFNFVDDTTEQVDPNQTRIPEGGHMGNPIEVTGTTLAEDFHNHADLRTQDAIDTSTPIEAEFTDEQMDQMEGQAWEKNIQADDNNFNL